MTEYYTNESAEEMLLESAGVHVDPGDKRIEVGDCVEIETRGGWCLNGVVDHIPCKSSDCWIIIEEDGFPRYCYDPRSINPVKKGEKA